MRMTRKRHRAWRKKQENHDLAVKAQTSRSALRRWREVQQRQRRMKKSVACMTAGSFGLMTFLSSSRLEAAGKLQPWQQAQADMEQVSQENHLNHEQKRWARKKEENAKAQQEAEQKLSAAQQYAAECAEKLQIYETSNLHTQLTQERHAYWQQEKEKAEAARVKAELDLTDKQVEALEIDRRCQELQNKNHVRAGIEYSSWSGKRKGSQFVIPAEASLQQDNWSIKARGGFLIQDEKQDGNAFTSLLDTDLEAGVTAYRAGPRSLQYLLGLHLPTGREQSLKDIIPDGLGSVDYVHRGWEMTPGIAFSYYYTPEDVLTTRLDFSFAGSYDAPDFKGWQPEIHPGNRFCQTVTYQHEGSMSSYMLRAMHESEEKTDFGAGSYRPGDKMFLGAYGERYLSDRDALQLYGVTFRQMGGSYHLLLPAVTDGRYNGTIYGLGWRHEVNPDLSYYVRTDYMKTSGLHIDPDRYLWQQDTKRWRASIGFKRRMAENLQLQAELAYYKQQDHWQGDYHGYQCSFMLNKTF